VLHVIMDEDTELNGKCLVCGKAFHTYPSKIKMGKAKYCSRACYYSVSRVGRKGCPCSDEKKAKISASNKGRVISAETKAKLSTALKGRTHTLETRAKQSAARMGMVFSPEHRANLAAAKLGKKRPPFTIEHKEKIGLSNKGKVHSPEQDEKQAARLRGVKRSPESIEKSNAGHRGDKCYAWKGGISFEPYCPKFNKDLRRRIRSFFGYRCVTCGKSTEENTKSLSCHHIEYRKTACCDNLPVQFAALCAKCHAKTNHDRERWESMMHRIIDEIWSGRSYFTKEEWSELQATSQPLFMARRREEIISAQISFL
jgi:hypothetical protein